MRPAASLAFAVAFVIACAVAAFAAPSGPSPYPRELDVSVVRRGALTRFRVDGNHLVVRAPPDDVVVDRPLKPVEQARLSSEARAVLGDDQTEFSCGRGDETFVAVTVDEHLTYTALCSGSDLPHENAWARLLKTLSEISGRTISTGDRGP